MGWADAPLVEEGQNWQNAPEDGPQKRRSPLQMGVDLLSAVPEAAATIGTGMAAQPAAGYAGMAGSVAPGPEGQGAAWAGKTQQALTYQPHSPEAQGLVSLAGIPGMLLNAGSNYVGEHVADRMGPLMGTIAKTGLDAIPYMFGGGLLSSASRSASAVRAAPKAASIAPAAAAAFPNIETAVQLKLKQGGIDWKNLAPDVQQKVMDFAKSANNFEGTDPTALARVARAANLRHPVPLTVGQSTRREGQLRSEEILKKTESGRQISERHLDQNDALLANLESIKQSAAPKSVSLEDIGRRMAGEKGKGQKTDIEGALTIAERKSNENIDSLYDKARSAGEMEKTVDIKPLTEYLRTHENPATVGFIASKLKSLNLAKDDQFGNLVPTHDITLNELEGIRRAASKVAGTSSDGTTRLYAGEAVRAIDKMVPDSAGGQAYKAARAARSQHAMKFEEPKIISDLLKDSSRTDRKVALEDVWNKTVLGGSIADLQRIKLQLLSAKDKHTLEAGRKAWRDVAAQTVEYIKGEATKGVSLNERQKPEVNPGQMKRAIDKIGPKKLEMLIGKSAADELRATLETAQDVKTIPASKEGSSTVSNAVSLMDKLLLGPAGGGAAGLAGGLMMEGMTGGASFGAAGAVAGHFIKQAREKKMMELKKQAEEKAASEALYNPLFKQSVPLNRIGK